MALHTRSIVREYFLMRDWLCQYWSRVVCFCVVLELLVGYMLVVHDRGIADSTCPDNANGRCLAADRTNLVPYDSEHPGTG